MRNKSLGKCVRWIGDNRADMKGRCRLEEKINPAFGVQATAFDQIRCINPVTLRPQNIDDCSVAACWLPNRAGKVLDLQEGVYSFGRGGVKIVPMLG